MGHMISMYSLLFGATYIILGLLTLAIFPKDNDRISLFMLSLGIMFSGIAMIFLVPSSLFYLSAMFLPYVISIIMIILIILSERQTYIARTLPLSAATTIILFLLMPKEVSILIFLHTFIYFMLLLRLFYSKFSMGEIFLAVYILLIVAIFYGFASINIFEGLLIILSIIVLYYFYLDRKNISGEYGGFEIRRKLTHLLVFIIVIPLPWLSQITNTVKQALCNIDPSISTTISPNNMINILVVTLGVCAIPIFLLVEYLRISKKVMLIPPDLLRRHEKNSIASYVYSISSAFIVALLFPQLIFITAVIVGLMADAAAALVGVYYGHHKITENRTLEGTIAGFLTSLLAVTLIIHNVLAGILVALINSIFDATNIWEINDNFVFPILTAIVLSFF